MRKTILALLAAVALLGGMTVPALASRATGHTFTVRVHLPGTDRRCDEYIKGFEGNNPNFQTWWHANTCNWEQQVAGKCKAFRSPAVVWLHGPWRQPLYKTSTRSCDDSTSAPVQMNVNISRNWGKTYVYCELWPTNKC
jgi:hypothetical protein